MVAKGFRKSTLDSGLRILTSRMPHTRSVSITVCVGVGSRYESAEQAGLSHFIEHLVFKGTNARPNPGEISAAIEGTGGDLNAGTEQELTVYWCKVPQPHLREGLDVLIDILRNSLLDPDSIERERMVVMEELNMINDYPDYKVDALIEEMLWPDHPLGREVGGTKDSVPNITRDMILEHMAYYYTPSNIVISVAGNVSHQEVVRQVEALCDGWRSANPRGWAPVSHIQAAPQCRLEYRRTEQTHLSVAVPGMSLDHPDRYVLDLLSIVFGEGMSSRLFVEVRERRGLAYEVHSAVTHFLDCGAFVIAAGVDSKRLYEAVKTILEQVSELRDGVSEEELEMAKRLATGRLLLRMEDTRAVSGWMAAQEMLLGRELDVDEVVESVNMVTTEDIRKVANDLLVTEKLNMAVVGPSRGRDRLQRLLKL